MIIKSEQSQSPKLAVSISLFVRVATTGLLIYAQEVVKITNAGDLFLLHGVGL